jgi:GT2 family glycosyltransferase
MIPVLIVPILTGPQLLYRMLDSIDRPIARLVIIDNGNALNTSTGWPVEHVQRTSVIKMPANLGVAGSWNLGIKATPFAPWWLIVNHDVTFAPGALGQFATMAAPDTLVLNGGPQPWCAFAIGEDVVRDVGLFDEGLHPGYFEDVDMERRCTPTVPIVRLPAGLIHHDNSSTLASGYGEQNNRTYASNAEYYQRKVGAGDLTEGTWSLARRRANSWD